MLGTGAAGADTEPNLWDHDDLLTGLTGLVGPRRPLDGTHVTDGDRRERQLSAVFHLDVDVGWKVEVIGRDRMHVVYESTDCSDANDCPPAFLDRSCSKQTQASNGQLTCHMQHDNVVEPNDSIINYTSQYTQYAKTINLYYKTGHFYFMTILANVSTTIFTILLFYNNQLNNFSNRI